MVLQVHALLTGLFRQSSNGNFQSFALITCLRRLSTTILFYICSVIPLHSQNSILLSGEIIDSTSAQKVLFSNLVLEGRQSQMMTSDENGAFKVKVLPGKYTLRMTHIAYADVSIALNVQRDTFIRLNTYPVSTQLNTITVQGEAFYGQEKIQSADMSTIELNSKQIQRIPNIAGEQDILKVVQLQSGVSRGIEGSGDYFVRGGDADQNLLLLDGATVYNSGHLFGFISVFNPDAIGDARFIKGAFPASYGGRLSSVLDIKTADEIPDRTEINGSIGIISSRLTVKSASKDKKWSFMVSGRRTYIDKILDAVDSEVRVPYYFYDFNAKAVYRPNAKNSFYISSYLGADILDYSQPSRNNESTFNANFDIDNKSYSFGWKHLFSEKTFSDLVVTKTDFNYGIFNSFFENEIRTTSGISDLTGKYEIRKFANNRLNYTLGGEVQHHNISPIEINSQGLVANFLPSSRSSSLTFQEYALFANIEKDLSIRWKLSAGYRHSFATSQSELYNNFEPRLAMRYKLNDRSSIKAGYSRMSQYMHRVSSSAITLPVDLWYGVTDAIKPQTSNQWVLGYFVSWPDKMLVFESEVYYKNMDQITEYAEGTNLILNTEFEESLLQGSGDSYGIELSAKKEGEKWQLTTNYTLSWSNRFFEELNNGTPFPAKYDRRHNTSIVGMYDLNDRWSFSLVWEYISGSRFTPVIGQYSLLNPLNSGLDLYYIYSDRNEVRLSDTHRLDVLLIYTPETKGRMKGEWHLGVYNVYNRASPIAISIVDNGGNNFNYEQPGIFGMIPTVSYHFKF